MRCTAHRAPRTTHHAPRTAAPPHRRTAHRRTAHRRTRRGTPPLRGVDSHLTAEGASAGRGALRRPPRSRGRPCRGCWRGARQRSSWPRCSRAASTPHPRGTPHAASHPPQVAGSGHRRPEGDRPGGQGPRAEAARREAARAADGAAHAEAHQGGRAPSCLEVCELLYILNFTRMKWLELRRLPPICDSHGFCGVRATGRGLVTLLA